MNPDKIVLRTPSKAFEFEKTARRMDKIKDPDELRNLAKDFLKLYLKQQEAIITI